MDVDIRAFLKRQAPILGLFAVVAPVWTVWLHGAICIEGGIVVGFPWTFYDRCYAPPPPGGVMTLGPPEFLVLPLVFDVVLWYVASWVGVVLLRRATGR